MSEDFLTWASLSTWSGMVLITIVLTQFTKQIFDWGLAKLGVHLETKYLAFLCAFVVLALDWWHNGKLTFGTLPLALLNALFISLAAMKGWETVREGALNGPAAAAGGGGIPVAGPSQPLPALPRPGEAGGSGPVESWSADPADGPPADGLPADLADDPGLNPASGPANPASDPAAAASGASDPAPGSSVLAPATPG